MKYSDLEIAFDYLNSGDPYEKAVYVSRSSGLAYYRSDAAGIDELPADVEKNDDFVELPNRYDLDLGKQLVWDFVNREIPEQVKKSDRFFLVPAPTRSTRHSWQGSIGSMRGIASKKNAPSRCFSSGAKVSEFRSTGELAGPPFSKRGPSRNDAAFGPHQDRRRATCVPNLLQLFTHGVGPRLYTGGGIRNVS